MPSIGSQRQGSMLVKGMQRRLLGGVRLTASAESSKLLAAGTAGGLTKTADVSEVRCGDATKADDPNSRCGA